MNEFVPLSPLPVPRFVRCLLLLTALLIASSALPAQQMAITFDDLPAHGELPPNTSRLQIASTILAALKAANMPPTYGFINGSTVAEDPENAAVLKAWRDAGQPLGNHTWSHPSLNDLPAAAFEQEIEQNEPLLKQFMGEQDWHWFRYPFLNEGDTRAKRRDVRAWLTAHGYRIAEVNMDFEDYLWNDPYARCSARKDDVAIKRLHDTYLATADQYIRVFHRLSHMVYGRDVKYVLLLHVGAFDARMLPDLLRLYRHRGFHFISLPEAEKDRAYRDNPDLGDKSGGTLLEQMMEKRHLPFFDYTKPYRELDKMCR